MVNNSEIIEDKETVDDRTASDVQETLENCDRLTEALDDSEEKTQRLSADSTEDINGEIDNTAQQGVSLNSKRKKNESRSEPDQNQKQVTSISLRFVILTG